ncbi:MAG: CpsD/CapB family tyrosine-protein kinase [Candidatus Acidiferrales bacterium]
MSKLYEALRRMEQEKLGPSGALPETHIPVDFLGTAFEPPVEYVEDALSATLAPTPQSRVIAFNEPRSLGAEKFRALATRLEHLRRQKEYKSMQVTSAVINEGKTLVAANLAITLARQAGSRVLLVEGDLHRPSLTSLLFQSSMNGISHWWTEAEGSLQPYIRKVSDLSLSYLSAGMPSEEPAQLLQSARFAEAFSKVISAFDWVVVDSTPMSPVVDANLWSRLVDGTLLVVREGVTPTRELKKGLASLDTPKLLGVVLNEASEFDYMHYQDQYGYPPRLEASGNGGPRFRRYLVHVDRVRTWLQADMRHSARRPRRKN